MKALHLDLGKGKVPRKTEGWSDKQIHNKSEEDIEKMINGAEMVLETLKKNVSDQEQRVHDLNRVLRRKKELIEEGYNPE